MNCEYDKVVGGTARGLKLLKTDNSTAAITSHNNKFLTISFNAVTYLAEDAEPSWPFRS